MEGFRLDGRTAVITGAGSGIGRACAEVFSWAGAHVVLAGRRVQPLEEVAQSTGGSVAPCDVSDAAQVARLFEDARARTGKVDVLVNNAGGPGPIAPVAEVDLGEWRACMEVNLFGALHCLQAAARVMKAQGSGSIINMSSLMGLEGRPNRTAYCASKFSLVGMTEAAAQELGPFGVRVNALLPGAVSGENMDRILARQAQVEGREVSEIIEEKYVKPAALRRWVAPREVALAALWYACDASAATTGDKM
ncbi:MAG: SDR family oxidoreductase, partial [Pseudomonadota bacterium]